MTPKEPYLIRAYYSWIVENDLTPYIVVNTKQAGVQVPGRFVQSNGQITLNISPSATGNLLMNDVAIEFNARFSGKSYRLYIPCNSVMAIYAKENGEGSSFTVELVEEEAGALEPEDAKTGDKPKRKASHLSVVK